MVFGFVYLLVFVPVQAKNLWLSCQEIPYLFGEGFQWQPKSIYSKLLVIYIQASGILTQPPMIFEESVPVLFQKQGCDARVFTYHKLVSEKIVEGVKLYILVILLGN